MDRELTLIEHLGELRKRIIICLATLGLATVFSFPFAKTILKVLKIPASGLIPQLAYFSPQEAFSVYMNISFLAGWIISLPVILYHTWRFVSPALEDKFKRNIFSFIFFCFLAFLLGAAFSFFLLIPPALKFLLGFAGEELEAVISAQKYISFVTSLIFACGLVFQLPVLSFILARLGIINYLTLRKKYKYALVVIFILAAVITPTTDIFNMLILAVPMLLLYEVSIWISWLATQKVKPLG